MKIKELISKRVAGFSLTELLIVLVIIGILVLLALPNLMPLISKAKSTEAQINLGHIQTLEKSYFYLNSKYSPNLEEIGFEAEATVKDGGHANYRYEIVLASPTSFKAKAIAVVDFDGDGTFNEWEIDEKRTLKEIAKD